MIHGRSVALGQLSTLYTANCGAAQSTVFYFAILVFYDKSNSVIKKP